MRILLVFCCFVTFMFGANYSTAVSSLYQEGNNKVLGRLLPTVEVKLLEKVGDKQKIEFEGYIQDGVSNAIYFVPNRRILVAGMSKNSKFEYKILETLKDGGKTWHKIRVQLLTNAKEFTDSIDTLWKKAGTLYQNNCSLCHKVHPLHEFTANQWPSIINSMLSRTAISKEESFLVIQYVQRGAKDMPWKKSN